MGKKPWAVDDKVLTEASNVPGRITRIETFRDITKYDSEVVTRVTVEVRVPSVKSADFVTVTLVTTESALDRLNP